MWHNILGIKKILIIESEYYFLYQLFLLSKMGFDSISSN